jgi:release factor glutamine methyltransferase
MTVSGSAFATVVDRLVAAGCVAATDEAAELVAAASDDASLGAMVRRREQGEPLPWITGGLTFGGRWLHVDPGVYVPRFQTEELARRAARRLPVAGAAIDLCTGAGAIAAHLRAAVPTAVVVGVDRDPLAAANALRNGVASVVADVTVPLPVRRREGFDVVTAVAPYVPTGDLRFLPPDVRRYEARSALDGGGDGLDLVRHVVVAAVQLLRPDGWLLTELGGDQDDLVAPALDAAGFDLVEPWHDEDGDLRGVAARSSGSPPRR